MATKMTCDGCGREADHSTVSGTIRQIRVQTGSNMALTLNFDLCQKCMEYFRSLFPDKWPRARPKE